MTTNALPLPSWRPGAARDRILRFLDQALELPVADRVAYFDNDGTLWCERPTYVQYDFMVAELARQVEDDPSMGARAEFAAVLSGDPSQVAEIGLERVALALATLFEDLSPAEFSARVRGFMASASNGILGRPLRELTYQPMLELIDELRRREFTVGLVTGGGTEFVRAISEDLYAVPPELVVGTLITYEFARDESGRPVPRRTTHLLGQANEGEAKVLNIQTQLGRAPILAAGNSAGDAEMLEWALASDCGLALLVDHDDPDREFSYASVSGTLTEREPITARADRLGWTRVSMREDWSTVFGD